MQHLSVGIHTIHASHIPITTLICSLLGEQAVPALCHQASSDVAAINSKDIGAGSSGEPPA